METHILEKKRQNVGKGCIMSFDVIYPRNLEEYMNLRSCVLIDVRTREEFRSGHLLHAQNYPFEMIDEWENNLPRNRTLIFYCSHGGNSAQAARRLGLLGYHTASLIGGYQAMMKYLEKN